MVMKFHFLHPCSFFHLWLFNALFVVFQACEMVENLSMALQAPSSCSHKFVIKLSKYLMPRGLTIAQFHCMGKVFKLPKKILLYHYFPSIGCNCETCKGVLMSKSLHTTLHVVQFVFNNNLKTHVPFSLSSKRIASKNSIIS